MNFFRCFLLLSALFLFFLSSPAQAALESRFDSISFSPAVDGGDYFTIYGSQNLKPWQGNIGFYFDYANQPLRFTQPFTPNGRTSVVDNLFVGNLFGALGVTDWFEFGINIPIVFYNQFFTDDVTGAPDGGGSLGDIELFTKFRIVNNQDNGLVGFAISPFITLPSGYSQRYVGNGSVAGGLLFITDFLVHERFNLALNLGVNIRDDVRRYDVRVDDQFLYGVGGNVKITENWHGIVEAFGRGNLRNLFANSAESPFEVGGGFRYLFGTTGFAINFGANAGLIDGVGSPRVRGYVGFTWTPPARERDCSQCNNTPPDPRIRGNKIQIWGKIFFDTNKAVVKEISYPVLDDVVDVLKKNPQIKMLEVQGHTDSRASDEYNLELSERRADVVKDYLIQKGISANRLVSKGYGEAKPVTDNKTAEGMSQNRRTEFVILQKK